MVGNCFFCGCRGLLRGYRKLSSRLSDPFGYTITDSATTLDHLNMGVGVWWSMFDDPLVLFHDGARVLSPIDGKDGVVNQRNLLIYK